MATPAPNNVVKIETYKQRYSREADLRRGIWRITQEDVDRNTAMEEGPLAQAWFEAKLFLANIPTWAWVTGGLVAVGIFAARQK